MEVMPLSSALRFFSSASTELRHLLLFGDTPELVERDHAFCHGSAPVIPGGWQRYEGSRPNQPSANPVRAWATLQDPSLIEVNSKPVQRRSATLRQHSPLGFINAPPRPPRPLVLSRPAAAYGLPPGHSLEAAGSGSRGPDVSATQVLARGLGKVLQRINCRPALH